MTVSTVTSNRPQIIILSTASVRVFIIRSSPHGAANFSINTLWCHALLSRRHTHCSL